ncbi:MAG: ubiquinol-cytochrome c reductase iron-sulfur subunit [Bacteroidota bacterium]
MNQSISTPPGSSKAPAGRRDFLKYLLGASFVAWLASVLYPLLAYLRPPRMGEVEVTSLKVGKVSDFQPESGTIFKFGTRPSLLVKTSSGELKAFSAVCTHLDCTVQYRGDLGVIWCACHNGKYDLNGRNIAGPPPRPLQVYKVIVKDEDVIVSKET